MTLTTLWGPNHLISKTEKVAVVKVKERREGVRHSIELLGFNPIAGKTVILKPNFNTAVHFPGATHPDTLREIIVFLQEMKARSIIGERSGPPKTAGVMEALGIYTLDNGKRAVK